MPILVSVWMDIFSILGPAVEFYHLWLDEQRSPVHQPYTGVVVQVRGKGRVCLDYVPA